MPGEGVYVFDACAVIALLQAEVGAALVSELLGARQRCLLHAINACEIYYDLYRRDGQEIADGLQEVLAGYGIELIEEMPSSLWRTAGRLKAAWRRVSLADCFALALALGNSATLVTTDHRELDLWQRQEFVQFVS